MSIEDPVAPTPPAPVPPAPVAVEPVTTAPAFPLDAPAPDIPASAPPDAVVAPAPEVSTAPQPAPVEVGPAPAAPSAPPETVAPAEPGEPDAPAPATEPTPPADPVTPADAAPDAAPTAAETTATAPVATKPAEPEPPAPVKFNLEILDFAGKPVTGLKYRVIIAGKTYSGATDGQGRIAEIAGLEPDQPLEFLVRKSNGEYSSKYVGRVACTDMNVCAVSPHIKISVETEPHAGAAGVLPPPSPKPPASKAPVAPAAGGIAGGGKHPATTTQTCRTPAGNPNTTLTEKSADWAKRHHIPTFGLWSWEDFTAKTTVCTVPTYRPPEATALAPAAKAAPAAAAAGAPAKSTAPAQAAAPVAAPAPAPPAPPAAAQVPANVSAPTAVSVDQAVPPAVPKLIAIMEEQAGWKWKDMFADGKTSVGIMAGITNGTFEPDTGKATNISDSRCYPSVKIGLWRAGLVSGIRDDIPAMGAGDWLLSQGFRDVTASVPDGRWALPGDVLVYRYSAEKEAKNQIKFDARMAIYKEQLARWELANAALEAAKAEAAKNPQAKKKAPVKPKLKKPSPPTSENYGHIDVRTYDGYISDFKTVNLPLPSKLIVTGVYRKVCDPLADLRVRAYLDVIGSRETRGIPEAKSWYALNSPIDGSKEAKSIARHPWQDRPKPLTGTRVAGRFQIMIGTYTEAVETYGLPDSFVPANQQRIAVLKLETRKALGSIRSGDIEAATRLLAKEWTSLPGAGESGSYTMSQLKQDHQKFMKELIK